MCTKFWAENLKGRDHWEGVGVDGKIILEWILERNMVGSPCTGFIWLGKGVIGRLCEYSNKPRYFVKGGEYLE
jgi:hypothetical protein